MLSPRRQTLLEAAQSEAKRFGHPAAGALHLALAIERRAPGALGRAFGKGAGQRLASAIGRVRPGADGLHVRAFLESSATDDPGELLAALRPYLAPILGGERSASARSLRDSAVSASMPPAPPRADPGTEEPGSWSVGDVLLDLYEVLEVAGEGGMGLVHRVRHRVWGIDLAIKSPRPGSFESEAQRAAFEREAELWIGLGLHPHVCACHYVRRIGGIPRVFAEYAEGGSLERQVSDRTLYAGGPSAALERVLGVSIQAARGLAHAHARGVVHQDVKPANVLLSGDGEAKVTDFGIARAVVAPRADAPVGDPRVSLGGMTPAYRSPEQARAAAAPGAPALGPGTDVWSLAVSVLELFMGELPSPDGQAAGHVLARFREYGPADPGIPAVPGALADLLERCLQMDPGDRPAMADLARALETIYARETGARYPQAPAEEAELLSGELSNRALSMLDLRRPAEAERLWDEALAQDPHHPQATYNQGLHLWREARITDDDLVRRLEIVRGSRAGHWMDAVLLAEVHLERGDVAAATALLDAAREPAGDAPELASARELAVAAHDRGRSVRTIDGDGRMVESVALTPDGRLALCAGRLLGAQLWDVTGRRLRAFDPRGDLICSAAVATDGRIAILGGQSGTAWLWRPAVGGSIPALRGHTSNVESVALTPDGRLALTGSRDRTARLWDVASGRCLRTLEGHTQMLTSVALTPDGRIAVTGSHDGTVHVWDLVLGRRLQVIDAHRDWVHSVALTPDGRLALSGSQDTTARLWELPGGRCVGTLEGAAHWITAVAITADGRLALTGGEDRKLRVWQLPRGRCIRTLGGHTDRIASVALTPDGARALTGSADKTARLWKLRTEPPRPSGFAYARPRPAREAARIEAWLRAELADVERHLATGESAAAARRLRALRATPGFERHPRVLEQWRRAGRDRPRTRLIAAWQSKVVQAHDAGPRPVGKGFGNLPPDLGLPVAHTVPGPSPGIRAVAVTPDGRRALTASNDRNARVWELPSGACPYTLRHTEWATAAALTPDGRLALTGSHDGKAWLWEPDDAGLLKVLEGHEGAVASVAITADARLALTGSFDETARLWELGSGTCLRTLAEQRDPVNLTPDGHFALTAGRGDVRLWDVYTGSCLRVLEHADHVAATALSPDGRLAVTGSKRIVAVWDLKSGRCVRELEQSGYIQDLALSLDGRVALSGAMDRSVCVWDLDSGICLRTLEGHTEWVNSVALTADAHLALSGSHDGELRVWEIDWDYEL